MANGKAFLTEIQVEDEFAPPPHVGVKLQHPGAGEKQLVFPEVRPRTFQPYTPGHHMFGYPRGYGSKAQPKYALLHNRPRNLIRRDVFEFPPDMVADEEEAAAWERLLTQYKKAPSVASKVSQGSSAKFMPPVPKSPSHGSVVGSVASSSCCSSCGSCCTTASQPLSCSTCAAAERERKAAKARRRALQQALDGQSQVSSVHPSLYENLTSVSQQKSAATSRGTSSSAAMVAKLQEELEQEKRQRELMDKKLQELQLQQEQLLAKINGGAVTATPGA